MRIFVAEIVPMSQKSCNLQPISETESRFLAKKNERNDNVSNH